MIDIVQQLDEPLVHLEGSRDRFHDHLGISDGHPFDGVSGAACNRKQSDDRNCHKPCQHGVHLFSGQNHTTPTKPTSSRDSVTASRYVVTAL